MTVRIVIVDDEASAREVLSAYLRRAGYRTTTSATGREGLAAWMRHPPGLMLLGHSGSADHRGPRCERDSQARSRGSSRAAPASRRPFRGRRLVRGLEGEIAEPQREEAATQQLAADARRRLEAQRAAARVAAALGPGIRGSSSAGSNNRSGRGFGSAGGGRSPSGGSSGSGDGACMPYPGDGGNANHLCRGIAQGANTIGLDCTCS